MAARSGVAWLAAAAMTIAAGCGSSRVAPPPPRALHAGAAVEQSAVERPAAVLYDEEGESIEALRARLIEEAGELDEGWGGGPALRIDVLAHRPAGDGAPELALLVHTHTDDAGVVYFVMLAAQVTGGYRMFELVRDIEETEGYETDVGSFRDGRIEVIATSAGPVVRASLIHEHESGFNGCEGECCARWSVDRADTVLALCTLDVLDCQPLTTARAVRRGEAYSREDPRDASSPPCELPEDTYAPSPPDVESWTRSLTIDPDGTTHLRDLAGTPPARPAPGDRPFVELVQLLGEGQ